MLPRLHQRIGRMGAYNVIEINDSGVYLPVRNVKPV